ncbi:TetR/AcrR family transcriptional regulator [Bradyrhizobium sp. USDA 4486]
MARPREFDYDKALEGGLQQFWRAGYGATSLDDLLEKTGLSKSSLYGTFGSKHQMLLASLDRYIETVLQANVVDLQRGPARQAITRSFEKILGLAPSGKVCFLQVCASELAAHDQLVRSRVRCGLERLQQAYRDAVLRGQKDGEFDSDADADSLSTFLVANLYGLQTLGRAGLDTASRNKVLALVLRALG